MLCIHFVAVAFRSEKEVFEEGDPPIPILSQTLDPALTGSGHEYFVPTYSHKHRSSVSVVKADHMFLYMYMHWRTPFFHLDKYINIHLNLLHKHLSTYKHGNYTK